MSRGATNSLHESGTAQRQLSDDPANRADGRRPGVVGEGEVVDVDLRALGSRLQPLGKCDVHRRLAGTSYRKTFARHDHLLRIDDVHQLSDDDTECISGIVERTLRRSVACGSTLEDMLKAGVGRVVKDCRDGDVGGSTPDVAPIARRTDVTHRDVTHFSGMPVRAAYEFVIHDDAGSNACAQAEQYEGPAPNPRSEPMMGGRERLHVVAHRDG